MGATVSGERRAHILDGDQTGGGHRHGAGYGRSEFPAHWSDDTIVAMIEEIANDPSCVRVRQPNGRFRIEADRDGVRVRVIVDADGASIRTAHPIA